VADTKHSKPSKKNDVEDLCVAYILYFDEARGHVPLMIYPDDKYKNDKKYMRPIKYHSIWFFDIEEQAALDHIDLEYKGYTFFGKKFLTKSQRKKRRAGLVEETPETIVIIISLPNDINIFGDDLIRILTKVIRENFEDKLFEMIEADIAKDEVIKTPQIKKKIEKGEELTKKLWELIGKTIDDYFSDVVKQTDTASIKQQKAISYLALKGIDFSHITGVLSKDTFSKIKLFDPNSTANNELALRIPLSITNITIMEDSKELEILVRNNLDEELIDLTVKITHVKEFFEKEIMNQVIDLWFPKEELLFISPILPHVDEYLLFIINAKNERIFSKKIDLNLLRQKEE
jgi:hypothetical protein